VLCWHVQLPVPVNNADCVYMIQANATVVVLSSVVDIAVDVQLTINLRPGLSHFRYISYLDFVF